MKLEKTKQKSTKAFQINSPLDGSSLGIYKESSLKNLKDKIQKAKIAQKSWQDVNIKNRIKCLRSIRKTFCENITELVNTVQVETGKTSSEIYGAEIIANIELLDFYIKNSSKILIPEKISINPLNYPGKRGTIIHRPLGVIGVISSWNYPVALPMRAIVPAIVSGNAVVFKPSVMATLTGKLIGSIFKSNLPENLFVTAYGNKSVNEVIIDNVNKINFIGSVPVGKKIASRCANNLIPCSTELSGKDAAIVLDDCNFNRTVNGVVWGAFTNTGQNCASVERVYVHEKIFNQFVDAVLEKTSKLRIGEDIGPLRNERQMKMVLSHIENARKTGCKILSGGKRHNRLYLEPTVILVKDHNAFFMNEETFGPSLPIYKVKNFDESVKLANSSRFGLTTSIWTQNTRQAEIAALQIESGIVTINNCVFTGALASAPWGGVKETGCGVTNSKYGLLEMTSPGLVLTDRAKGPKESWWYPYSSEQLELMKTVVSALKGKISSYLKVPGLLKKVLKDD